MLLGLVAFWPEHVDKGISPLLARVTKAIPFITYDRMEFGANIALFLPFGVLLALLLSRRRYLVLPISFLASLAIESVQALLLPGRTPSVMDIVANTAGACVGLLAVELIQLRRRRPR
ncbi:VanZ family protein [Microbacterium sp.]|uniref:VanZ family protein n=1 Tax=Microbacterium sp. TaxID=51671 RepID=UPI0033414CC1